MLPWYCIKVEYRLFCLILFRNCRYRNFSELLSYRHTRNRSFFVSCVSSQREGRRESAKVHFQGFSKSPSRRSLAKREGQRPFIYRRRRKKRRRIPFENIGRVSVRSFRKGRSYSREFSPTRRASRAPFRVPNARVIRSTSPDASRSKFRPPTRRSE